MKKLTAADSETKSPDIKAENLAALRALFPELVTEGPDGVAVNLDVLKQLVGDQRKTGQVSLMRVREPNLLGSSALCVMLA